MTAIVLALAASLSWGIGDFLGGLSSRRLATLTVLATSEAAGLAAIALVVVAQQAEPPPATAFAAAAAAGVAGLIGLGCLYRGMAVGAMAIVAPISAAAAVVPVVVGLARGERPGALQLAGVALILVGVALASREPGHRRLAAGVPLALLAAAGFGGYFVFIDEASADGATWAVLVSRGVATVVAVAVALGARSPLPDARILPLLIAIGLFDVGANGLLALALNEGFVSLVSVLASLYPVVTVLLARAVIGERVAHLQAAGIIGALAGVGLVAAG